MALSGVILMLSLTACQPLPIPAPARALDVQAAYLQLAEGYFDVGLWAQAEQATARAATQDATDPRVAGLWARLAAARGDHAVAEAYFREAAPVDPDAAHHFARYLLAQQRPQEALHWLSQLTQAQASLGRAEAWAQTGQAYEALAQLARADEAYQARLRLEPENPVAITDWVLIAAKRGQQTEAYARLDRAQHAGNVQLDWEALRAQIAARHARFLGLTDGFGVLKH